jgi:hypothetical protein
VSSVVGLRSQLRQACTRQAVIDEPSLDRVVQLLQPSGQRVPKVITGALGRLPPNLPKYVMRSVTALVARVRGSMRRVSPVPWKALNAIRPAAV